jgi:hypothetical protein
VIEDQIVNRDIYNGILSLIGAMFRLAAQDLKFGGKNGRRAEALEFIESEWFSDLCCYMNVDTNRVRKLILNGRVRQREEYRR